MANKELADIEEREESLRKRLGYTFLLNFYRELSKVENDTPANWKEIQNKLNLLLQEKKKRDDDDKKFDEYVRKLEQEKELEKLVARKIELEKLRNQTQLIDHLMAQKQAELEGVKLISEKKDINNSSLLQKALKKGDVLQRKIDGGHLDKRHQALLAESYLMDDPEEGRKIREGIFEDLKGKMTRDKRELSYKTASMIQEYNKKRNELAKKEEEIYLKREQISKLEERGIDFLAEIELGNAPPIELIMKNLKINAQQVIQDACENKPFDIEATISFSKILAEQGEQRLSSIRQMIENEQKSFLVDKPYEPPNIPLDPRSKAVAEYIMRIILSNVFDRIERYERRLEDLKAKQKYLAHKSGKQNQRISEIYKRRALYEYFFRMADFL